MEERTLELLIGALREDVGCQRELANTLGKNEATISRWLTKLTMPLDVWITCFVTKGKIMFLKLLARAAGFELVPLGQKQPLIARIKQSLLEIFESMEREAV